MADITEVDARRSPVPTDHSELLAKLKSRLSQKLQKAADPPAPAQSQSPDLDSISAAFSPPSPIENEPTTYYVSRDNSVESLNEERKDYMTPLDQPRSESTVSGNRNSLMPADPELMRQQVRNLRAEADEQEREIGEIHREMEQLDSTTEDLSTSIESIYKKVSAMHTLMSRQQQKLLDAQKQRVVLTHKCMTVMQQYVGNTEEIEFLHVRLQKFTKLSHRPDAEDGEYDEVLPKDSPQKRLRAEPVFDTMSRETNREQPIIDTRQMSAAYVQNNNMPYAPAQPYISQESIGARSQSFTYGNVYQYPLHPSANSAQNLPQHPNMNNFPAQQQIPPQYSQMFQMPVMPGMAPYGYSQSSSQPMQWVSQQYNYSQPRPLINDALRPKEWDS